ncbi:uncharacterized protein LOC121861483 [Homarus americanus]|nr:uncharacterized protein LOC121861483 [Homarus americanus]
MSTFLIKPVNAPTSRRDSESTGNHNGSSDNTVFCNDRTDGESTGTSVAAEDNFDNDFDIHDSEEFTGTHDSEEFTDTPESEVTEEYEFETASSFVAPQQEPLRLVPMTSASVLPTPAISKHISKLIGGSSTPRAKNMLKSSVEPLEEQVPMTLKEDIAICFGFEDSEHDFEKSSLNLSPVRRSGLSSCLEVTGTSEVHMECRPSSRPSRFSWGPLRPGYTSYVSNICSSSVFADGHNVSSVSRFSGAVYAKKPTLKKTKYGKNFVLQKEDKENLHCSQVSPRKSQRKTNKSSLLAAENEDCTGEGGDISVLFDEDEVMEDHLKGKEKQIKPTLKDSSPKLSPYLSKENEYQSPEKSFSKPPRKSYDKNALEEARRKFLRDFGGGTATETETEEDEAVIKKKQKRKKPLKSKSASKKVKTKTNLSQNSTGILSNISARTNTLKNNGNSAIEQSLHEWASHLNSHFSEVDDSILVTD